MEGEIAIQAEILTMSTCQFTADRPVFPEDSAYFGSREAAKGSPLAEALFEIDEVVGVLVSHNIVKVTKAGYDDWYPIARKIGPIIRSQLQSGVPAISEFVRENRPSEDVIRKKIEQLFEEQINPAVAQHGGYVELVNVRGNVVYLRMGGGCQGCGMASMTLRQGIEHAIRDQISEVGDILDVTDHASGRNPYYSPPDRRI